MGSQLSILFGWPIRSFCQLTMFGLHSVFLTSRSASLPVETARRLTAERTIFLCENCSKLDLWDTGEDAPTYICNQQEKTGFLESAREGCQICGLVLELISRSTPLAQLTSGYNIHFRDHLLLGFKASYVIDEVAMNEIAVTTYLTPGRTKPNLSGPGADLIQMTLLPQVIP
jgi:hypothetical protein